MRSSMCSRISVQNAPFHLTIWPACHLHTELIPSFSECGQHLLHASMTELSMLQCIIYLAIPLKSSENIDTWLNGYMAVSFPLNLEIRESSISHWSTLHLSLSLAQCFEQSRCSVNIKQIYLHPSSIAFNDHKCVTFYMTFGAS